MTRQLQKQADDGRSDDISDKARKLASASARMLADLGERMGRATVDPLLLGAFIDQVPDLFYAKDTEGRFLLANPATAREWGQEHPQDLVGKTDFELLPPDVAQRHHDLEQQVVASGQSLVDLEEEALDSWGAPRWLRTTRLPLVDVEGRIAGVIGVSHDITARKRLEEAAEAERWLFRSMIDQVHGYLFVKDTQSRFLIANRAVAADLGRVPEDLIGKSDFDLHKPELARRFFDDEQAVIRSGEPQVDIEEYLLTVTGERKWLSTSKAPLRDEHGEIIGMVGISRDITDRKEAEAALAESQSRWNFALDGAGQGVWDHDIANGKAFFSSQWRRMRGIGPDEVVKSSLEDWLEQVHPDDRDRLRETVARQNSGDVPGNAFEYRERRRDGKYIWILSRGRPVEWTPDGRVARIIGTDTDITSIKEAEARLAEEKEQTYRRHVAALEKAQAAAETAQKLAQALARHDVLTGLPNRRVFGEALEAAALQHGRGGLPFAVLIIDLDRFKPVNDVHGHESGDLVLREVAGRISAVVRAGDTVARLGGDEFAVILHCLSPTEDAAAAAGQLAARINASVAQPIDTGDRRVDVGASVGIAVCPDDGTDPGTLLRAADMAMYSAKDDGKGTYRFFQRTMEEALRARSELEVDVRRAVTNEEIRPYYQPLIKLAGEQLVGFEILARWHHPDRGDVGPDTFIPVVEKLGLIGEMTYTILRLACLDAREWPAHITIALNVSPVHLVDPLLPAKILSVLAETGFPPHRLEIEITESALVSDLHVARAALVTLQEVGIKISLDDFGTGYSNLHNLQELHFDKIKIDRSFVLSMESNPESAKIVRSVINLAQSLGLPTIAEGIEDRQAMDQIMASGGEYGQGYHFAKALPAAEAAALVRKSDEK